MNTATAANNEAADNAPAAARPAPGGPATATDDPAPAVPPAVALWSALVAAHAALDRALERDSGTCPVVGPDVLGVLLPLAAAPDGRLRLGDLAERAGLTPSGLTRRIEPLEAGGLMLRRHCESDRRGIWAAITPAGVAALPAALGHHAQALDRAVARNLSPGDAARLTELLEALARP